MTGEHSKPDSVSSDRHFNELKPAQAEALALIAEECAEVIQIIAKIQRHGLESCHPDSRELNYDTLQKEIGDVMAAFRIGEVQFLINWGLVIKARDRKLMRVQQYLHHAKVIKDDE